jgi:hypothetical protein
MLTNMRGLERTTTKAGSVVHHSGNKVRDG